MKRLRIFEEWTYGEADQMCAGSKNPLRLKLQESRGAEKIKNLYLFRVLARNWYVCLYEVRTQRSCRHQEKGPYLTIPMLGIAVRAG